MAQDTGDQIQRALAQLEAGNTDAACVAFKSLSDANPDDPQPWHFLGICHHAQGNPVEAEKCLRQAIANQSSSPYTYFNLGSLLAKEERFTEAMSLFGKAIELKPDLADAHVGLAYIHLKYGDFSEAGSSCNTALQIEPNLAEAYYTQGQILAARENWRGAIESYQKAIQINSDYADAYNNLGNAYLGLSDLNQAIECYKHAIQIDRNHYKAYTNLGSVHAQRFETDLAIECFRTAISRNPAATVAWDTYLFYLNYSPGTPPSFIMEEHERWGQQSTHANAPLKPEKHISYVSDKRLKIGYVSPDFWFHSVSFFIEPILANHNPENVEVFCYSESSKNDATTQRLKSFAHHWRKTTGFSDADVAKQISADDIDILVDLAGHTSGNRLSVFSYQPAPIQATYLGYPNTTGNQKINYLITDSCVDPTGADIYFTENLIRLPGTFCCYQPPADAPAVSLPPSSTHGHITFTSMNNLVKFNDCVLALWARIFNEVPNSRLILQAREFSDRRYRDLICKRLVKNGIAISRTQLMPSMEFQDHLAVYNNVDIALDTFPWCGHTTSCHALWMGVPVVTLAGDHHASRMASSILHAIGLSEMVAGTHDEYVKIAVTLAHDQPRLRELRIRMRDRMLNSPLCDATGFTRDLEAEYRKMWITLCQNQPGQILT